MSSFGLEALSRFAPGDIPRLDEIRIGWEVFLLPPAIAVALSVLFTAVASPHLPHALPVPRDSRRGTGSNRAARFYEALAQRVGRLPGVEGAAFGECLPLDELCDLSGVPMAPAGEILPGEAPVVVTKRVSPAHHETLGIPLLRGRTLHSSDADAVVVSRNLALRFWGKDDPIGKQLKVEAFSSSPSQQLFTVVGVKAWDGTTFASVLAFLAGVTLLATYLPARGAAVEDAVATLRAE